MTDKPEIQPLLPETAFPIFAVPVDQIASSPFQARKMFDEGSLNGLAESMKQEGLIQPITVRTVDENCRGGPQSALTMESNENPPDDQGALRCAPTHPKYELVSGERRLRAAKLLAWPTIPARVIQTISQGETAAKGLIENLQREDLNPMEEAEGFYHLNKLSPDYWDQNKIARATGRTQGYVSQSICLLKLAPEIQENIRRLIFSRSLGLEIGRLDNQDQQRKVLTVIGKNPTVKTARKRVDEELGWISRKTKKKPEPDPLIDLWQKLKQSTPVAPSESWGVAYQGEGTWSFRCTSQNPDAKKALAAWFKKMADALGK